MMDTALDGGRPRESQSRFIDRTPDQNFQLRAMQEKETIQRWFRALPKPVLDHDPTLDDVERFVYRQLRLYFAARRGRS